jgi:hypothetical protein
MSIRRHMRTLVALGAAYAVALQALLLAVGGPIAGAGQFAALPICSALSSASGAGHSAPAGHGHDCPGCFGCCCGTPVCPAPAPALTYAPAFLQNVAAVLASVPLLPVRTATAHRSRAPPDFA